MKFSLLSLFLSPIISSINCDCIVYNETLSGLMNGNINPVVGCLLVADGFVYDRVNLNIIGITELVGF